MNTCIKDEKGRKESLGTKGWFAIMSFIGFFIWYLIVAYHLLITFAWRIDLTISLGAFTLALLIFIFSFDRKTSKITILRNFLALSLAIVSILVTVSIKDDILKLQEEQKKTLQK